MVEHIDLSGFKDQVFDGLLRHLVSSCFDSSFRGLSKWDHYIQYHWGIMELMRAVPKKFKLYLQPKESQELI